MAFLKKLKSDPKNLVGPDLNKAPNRKIELSGTTFSFLCPPQTAQVPAFIGGSIFDIDRDPEFVEGASSKNNASVAIYSNGWEFCDRAVMGTPYGSLLMDVILLRNTEQRDSRTSLLIDSVFEQWVYDTVYSIYGLWNKDMLENESDFIEPVIPEQDFWRYPRTKEEIRWESYSGSRWVQFEIYQPGRVPNIRYETPISNNHVIRVSWTPSSFETDYFSPNHNLRVATKELMDAIMASMKIELSAEAKKQFIEAGVDVP